jgi:hypothetical protein
MQLDGTGGDTRSRLSAYTDSAANENNEARNAEANTHDEILRLVRLLACSGMDYGSIDAFVPHIPFWLFEAEQ